MNNRLKAGLYKRVITPQVNAPIVGGFDAPKPDDILEDFYAHALVLDDGTNEIAIVSVDILFVSRKIAYEIAERVEKLCAIPRERVVIHAVHNHTGVMLQDGGDHDGLAGFLAGGEKSPAADAYTEFFMESVVSAIYLAKKRKQNVRIGVGRDFNGKYVFNRRLRKPDGSIIMNWTDRENLRDCDGDGVKDPEMIVLKLESEAGAPVGFIVNYANHNNACAGYSRTTDISGHIGRLLAKIYGDHVVTLFLQGACGNTNWINFRDFSQKDDTALYRKIAMGLTGTALGIIAGMEYPQIDGISISRATISVPERPYGDYDDKVDDTFGRLDVVSWENPESAFKFFKDAKAKNKDIPLEVYDLDLNVLTIGGDIAIATNPTELFSDFGLMIKSGSPFKYTMIVELSNGSFGYVPTPYAYGEGGYEVRKPASRMVHGAGDMIVQSTLMLLSEAHSQYNDAHT